MVRIYIVRPGSTEFDEQGRIKGTLDIPLSQYGSGQVNRTANELVQQGIEVVYAAPCQSAEETAALLAEKLGTRQKTLSKLTNLDHGLWQGKLIEDVKEKQPKVYRQWQEQPETVCPPEGEMLEHARQRVHASLDRLIKKHKNGCIAIVLPEPLASLAQCYLERGNLGDLWQAETECGTWVQLDFHPEAFATDVK
ncbi:MAG: histidine phosphatase family protein [Planctomycetales bacterium]|nr:histidine phosphatase family protein [Planctomycetales bacterium]